MSKLAFVSDPEFTTEKLFNKTGGSTVSPYNWIKSEDAMGIRPAQIYDLCANSLNLAAYSEYGSALLYGTPNSAINTESAPLGVRYFAPAAGDMPKKCGAPDGSVVDQYYVIDSISDGIPIKSSDGKNTYNGNGIVFSAASSVQKIDSSRFVPFFKTNPNNSITFLSPKSDDYNKCKKIQITTDLQGNTDSNYVSLYDANQLIKSGVAKEAFQSEHHLASPNHSVVVNGHDGKWTRNISGTDFDGYIIGADLSDPVYLSNKPIVIHDIPSMYSSYASIEDNDDTDYIKAQKWIQDQIDMRNESREAAKKGYDTITGFFLGSITVLGLFIVFQFLDIRTAARMHK